MWPWINVTQLVGYGVGTITQVSKQQCSLIYPKENEHGGTQLLILLMLFIRVNTGNNPRFQYCETGQLSYFLFLPWNYLTIHTNMKGCVIVR